MLLRGCDPGCGTGERWVTTRSPFQVVSPRGPACGCQNDGRRHVGGLMPFCLLGREILGYKAHSVGGTWLILTQNPTAPRTGRLM